MSGEFVEWVEFLFLGGRFGRTFVVSNGFRFLFYDVVARRSV